MAEFRSGKVEIIGIAVLILLVIIIGIKQIHEDIDFFSNVKYWQGDEKIISLADKEKILDVFKKKCLFYSIAKPGPEISATETLSCYKELQINDVSESAFNAGFNYIKERFASY